MSELATPWRSVAAAFALNGILLGCWASRVPSVIAKFGLSEASFGLLLLLMGVGALVSFPFAGRLADRLGAVRVTRWLAALYLLTLVLVGLAPSVPALGVALFIFGMSHGAMDVTMNSWATEVEAHKGRSVMASFHAMWSLGAGLGAASGFVATSLSVPTGLHFAMLALLATVLFGPFLNTSWQSRVRATQTGDPAFVLPRGPLFLVGFMALGAGLGEGSVTDWSAVYLVDTVGTGESVATLGYAAFSVTMVIMRLCVDSLITRLGPVTVARASGLLAATGCLLTVGIPLLPVALAGFVLMGVGYAAIVPLAFSRAANDPEVPAGQGIASVATLGYGAMLLGPPAIGFVAEATSLRISFLLVGCLALMIAVLAPVLSRPARVTARA